MSLFNALFRERLGIPLEKKLVFEDLEEVLFNFATMIPFENLSILADNVKPITKKNLQDKILVRQEGGLCYELNPLLYYFLMENGFDARLVAANVYDAETKRPSKLGDSHVAILLNDNQQTYIVETGFGGNLPLKPVPLNGKTVVSSNGSFRARLIDEPNYNYALEIKIKHKDTDWRSGYAFHSERPITDDSELNAIQAIAVEHEQSRFNKDPLITKLTRDGNITLTSATFTQWKNGEMTKRTIDEAEFKTLAQLHFGLRVDGARKAP